MEYQSLSISTQDAVAHVQLNRPEAMNAMNQDFWQEFPQAIRELDASGDVRAIVISGAGKHFSAGMDLEVFANAGQILFQGEDGRRGELMRRLVLKLQDCFNAMEQVSMPVLTAIHGGCIGGAVDLVCASDMRYCTQDAYFVIKEIDMGMTADLGTLQRLPGLIAPGLARELAYTGRNMEAEEALRSGFVNQVFSDQDAMLDGVMGIARQIAAKSPLAVAGCKQMINYARDHALADSLNHMATWQAGMFQPTDIMEAMKAMQGDAPRFEDLRGGNLPLVDD